MAAGEQNPELAFLEPLQNVDARSRDSHAARSLSGNAARQTRALWQPGRDLRCVLRKRRLDCAQRWLELDGARRHVWDRYARGSRDLGPRVGRLDLPGSDV